MADTLRPEALFGLDMLAEHLAGFQPPTAAHDPAGDWELTYTAYCLAAEQGVGGPVGTLRLRRTRHDGERFVLDVVSEKRSAYRFTDSLTAEIEAHGTRLPEPLRWSWEELIRGLRGDVVPRSQLKRSATLQGGMLAIGSRKVPLTGPCTLHWLLMEAVGRLPREPFAPLTFTLLDQLDEVKTGHTLRYAESPTVLLGQSPLKPRAQPAAAHQPQAAEVIGRPVRLHAYHHFGDGVLPSVYWVDDQGRLLIAAAGVEAYVLNSFAKNQGGKS